MDAPKKSRWRRTLIVLHRDVGYLSVGLILVYGISGIATNHRHDWDYNQVSHVETRRVGTPAELLTELPPARRAELASSPGSVTDEEVPGLVARLGAVLGRTRPPRNTFWRNADRLSLHYEAGNQDTIDYRPSTGEVRHTVTRDRPVFRDLNFLHLNEGRRVWTWVADVFAVALLFLALSGPLLVKGRAGLVGRGGVLVALGVLLPIAAILALRYL